jgi:hypothetical protein
MKRQLVSRLALSWLFFGTLMCAACGKAAAPPPAPAAATTAAPAATAGSSVTFLSSHDQPETVDNAPIRIYRNPHAIPQQMNGKWLLTDPMDESLPISMLRAWVGANNGPQPHSGVQLKATIAIQPGMPIEFEFAKNNRKDAEIVTITQDPLSQGATVSPMWLTTKLTLAQESANPSSYRLKLADNANENAYRLNLVRANGATICLRANSGADCTFDQPAESNWMVVVKICEVGAESHCDQP